MAIDIEKKKYWPIHVWFSHFMRRKIAQNALATIYQHCGNHQEPLANALQHIKSHPEHLSNDMRSYHIAMLIFF